MPAQRYNLRNNRPYYHYAFTRRISQWSQENPDALCFLYCEEDQLDHLLAVIPYSFHITTRRGLINIPKAFAFVGVPYNFRLFPHLCNRIKFALDLDPQDPYVPIGVAIFYHGRRITKDRICFTFRTNENGRIIHFFL